MSVSACLLAVLCHLPAPRPQLADLQALIDPLPPGAILSLPSGSYAAAVVKKPLMLIGEDPTPTIASLSLAGTGGKLTLVNLRLNADLGGTGFDELRLFDCEIAASALRVTSLAYLELSRLAFSPPPGAIDVPGASVLLLDSVAGSLSSARLYQAGSTCPQVTVTDFERTLQNDLVMLQPALLGGRFTLSWSLASPVALLIGRSRTQSPLRVPRASAGFWHLAGPRWLVATVASPGSLTMQVPGDPVLFGMQIAFQVVGPSRTLSRPATAVLR